MKKALLIFISVALIVMAIICVVKYKQVPDEAHAYISNQKEQQRELAERQVDSLFVHRHTDIFPIYFGCKSRFVKGDALSQTGSWYRDIIKCGYRVSKMPSDITSTYRVAPENSPFFGDDVVEGVKMEIRMHNRNDNDIETGIQGVGWKGLWQTGWALGVRENYGFGRIAEYVIIPYAVSFRKQSFGTLEGYTSIDDVLDNAFKFYTENNKSDFKNSIVNNTRHFTYMPCIDNYFYHLEAEEKANFVTMTISDYADYGTYMYNDSYYVFIKGYGKKMYSLVLNEGRVTYLKEQFITDKRHKILAYGLSMLGFLVSAWIFLLILIIKEGRENKRTLLQRIIIKCNPKRFIKKYNGEKLKSANEIYSKAIAIEETDEGAILELASRAENELGIYIVSKNDIKALRGLCNPKRFMKPYDAAKVEKANDLYGRLTMNVIPFSDFVQIKGEIDKLCSKDNNDAENSREEPVSEQENLHIAN